MAECAGVHVVPAPAPAALSMPDVRSASGPENVPGTSRRPRSGARWCPGARSRSARRRRLVRNRGGSSAMPTPLGVPVRMRSPGSSVWVSARKWTRSATPKMRSLVLESWRSSPLTQVRRREVLGIGHLVGRRDPRAPRTERRRSLRPRPLRLAGLEVAGADVVGHGEAGEGPVGADHHDQLALVVEPPHDGGAAHRPAGRSDGGRHLREHDRLLGRRRAGLGGVSRVVEPDAVDRAGARRRREQGQVVQRPRRTAGGSRVGAREAGEHGRPVVEGDRLVVADLAGQRVGSVRRNEGGEPNGGARLREPPQWQCGTRDAPRRAVSQNRATKIPARAR